MNDRVICEVNKGFGVENTSILKFKDIFLYIEIEYFALIVPVSHDVH